MPPSRHRPLVPHTTADHLVHFFRIFAELLAGPGHYCHEQGSSSHAQEYIDTFVRETEAGQTTPEKQLKGDGAVQGEGDEEVGHECVVQDAARGVVVQIPCPLDARKHFDDPKNEQRNCHFLEVFHDILVSLLIHIIRIEQDLKFFPLFYLHEQY